MALLIVTPALFFTRGKPGLRSLCINRGTPGATPTHRSTLTLITVQLYFTVVERDCQRVLSSSHVLERINEHKAAQKLKTSS